MSNDANGIPGGEGQLVARLVTSLGTMVVAWKRRRRRRRSPTLWAWRRARKPMTTQEVTTRGRRTTTAQSFIG